MLDEWRGLYVGLCVCICPNKQSHSHSKVRAINQLRTDERYWKQVVAYIETQLPTQLESTSHLLDIEFANVPRVTFVRDRSGALTEQRINSVINELNAVEHSLNNAQDIAALKLLSKDALKKVSDALRKMIINTRGCVDEMR